MKEENIRLFKLIEMSGLSLDRVNNKEAALFYVLASSKNLFNQSNMIYNFKNNRLNLDFDDDGNTILGHITLNPEEKILLDLVLQLYNNSNNLSIMDIFNKLSNENRMVALETIRMRFSIYSNEYEELKEESIGIENKNSVDWFNYKKYKIDFNLEEREYTDEYKRKLKEIELKLLDNNESYDRDNLN